MPNLLTALLVAPLAVDTLPESTTESVVVLTFTVVELFNSKVFEMAKLRTDVPTVVKTIPSPVSELPKLNVAPLKVIADSAAN